MKKEIFIILTFLFAWFYLQASTISISHLKADKPFICVNDTLFVFLQKDTNTYNSIDAYYLDSGKIGGYFVYGFLHNNIKNNRFDSLGYLGMLIDLKEGCQHLHAYSLDWHTVNRRLLSLFDLREKLNNAVSTSHREIGQYFSFKDTNLKSIHLIIVTEDANHNYSLKEISDINYFHKPLDNVW